MSSTFHRGIEVIENQLSGTTVRDVTSSVTLLVGTAPIQDVHAASEDQKRFVNEPVIVRRRADGIAAFGNHKADYTIPSALDAIFDQGDGGTIIVVNVFDPSSHVTDGAPDPGLVNQVDIIGKITPGGKPTGLQIAYACFNRFGFWPKILLTPGFGGLTGVRSELEVIAEKLWAVAVVDIPVGFTKQMAVESRGVGGPANFNSSSDRLIMCWPHLKVIDSETGDLRLDPFSSRFAGVMIQADVEKGYHESPSNRPILGVEDAEQDVFYYPSHTSSDTNFLNEAGIVTYRRQFGTGLYTFGPNTAAFPSNSSMRNQIHARRTLDMIHEAAVRYLVPWIDRHGSRGNIEELEERVNAFLRRKEGEEAIYGGRFIFDRENAVSDMIAEGHFPYKLECAPMSIMQRITINSAIDYGFIRSNLGLAA